MRRFILCTNKMCTPPPPKAMAFASKFGKGRQSRRCIVTMVKMAKPLAKLMTSDFSLMSCTGMSGWLSVLRPDRSFGRMVDVKIYII